MMRLFDFCGNDKYGLLVNKCNYKYVKKHESEKMKVFKLHLIEKDTIIISPIDDAENHFLHDLYIYKKYKKN